MEDTKTMAYYSCQAPFGPIGLQLQEGILTRLDFILDQKRVLSDLDEKIQPYIAQLDAYFAGKLKTFTVPYKFTVGTPYQQKVWQQIAAIDYGQTKNYSEIAQNIESHARAVGQACGRNPVPIIVPCHRVLAKSGLGGFSQSTEKEMLNIKRSLLAIEGTL